MGKNKKGIKKSTEMKTQDMCTCKYTDSYTKNETRVPVYLTCEKEEVKAEIFQDKGKAKGIIKKLDCPSCPKKCFGYRLFELKEKERYEKKYGADYDDVDTMDLSDQFRFFYTKYQYRKFWAILPFVFFKIKKFVFHTVKRVKRIGKKGKSIPINPKQLTQSDFDRYEYNYRSSITKAIHEDLRIKFVRAGMMKDTIKRAGIPNDYFVFKEAFADDTVFSKELISAIQNPGIAEPGEKTAKQILATGIVEHRRWNVYMMTEGFSYGEKKNFITKKHPNIRPINELPDSEIRKDI
jgi:hypothetical protein